MRTACVRSVGLLSLEYSMRAPVNGEERGCRCGLPSRVRDRVSRTPSPQPSPALAREGAVPLEPPCSAQPERTRIRGSGRIDLFIFELQRQPLEQRGTDSYAVHEVLFAAAAVGIEIVGIEIHRSIDVIEEITDLRGQLH